MAVHTIHFVVVFLLSLETIFGRDNGFLGERLIKMRYRRRCQTPTDEMLDRKLSKYKLSETMGLGNDIPSMTYEQLGLYRVSCRFSQFIVIICKDKKTTVIL